MSIVRRAIWRCAGFGALTLGGIGAVLPVLPTVPFLLLAAFCFSRSDPALAARLYNHPRYGPAMREWQERRAINRQAKIAAVGAMTISIPFTGLVAGWPFAIIPFIVLATIGPWIWTRPE